MRKLKTHRKYRQNSSHILLYGEQIGLPLIEHCGINEIKEASPLDWQTHRGYKLVYILAGSACYEFGDSNTVKVEGNQFFVVLPGQSHQGLHNVNDPSSLIWIIFDPHTINAFERITFSAEDFNWIEARYKEIGNAATPISTKIRSQLTAFRSAVVSLLSNPGNTSDLVNLRSVICQLIAESARELSPRLKESPENRVRTVKQWIDRNYADEINVDQLAQELKICRSWLHRTFKEETGQTLIDYIQ